jgi:hypothetical protein
VWVIFISHLMVTVYTFNIINLFYFTKVRVLFRVCLGEVHAFKFASHKSVLGFFLFLPFLSVYCFQLNYEIFISQLEP